MAFTKAPKGTKVLRGQKKVWGEERRETGEAERLVKQRDSQREPVRDNAELRLHPQEEEETGERSDERELACS